MGNTGFKVSSVFFILIHLLDVSMCTSSIINSIAL